MAALNRRTTHVNSIREIRRFIEGNEFPNATIQRIQIVQANLQRHFDQFCAVHIELIGGQISQAELNVHETLKNEIETLVTDLQVTLLERLEQLNPVVQPAPVQPEPLQADQVQALELRRLIGQRIENTWGTFDGTLTRWATFRDFFTSAVHNDGIMTPEVKFQHLKKSLTGEAAEVLGEWEPTAANYALAWERLQRVYNRGHETATELLQTFNEVPSILVANRKELLHLSNVVNNVKRQLTSLGYNTQDWDLFFIAGIEQKLDEKTKLEWRYQHNQNDATLQQLLEFIENRARALASITPEPGKTKENRKRTGDEMENYFQTKKLVQNENQSKFKIYTSQKCLNPECNLSHPLQKCSHYLAKNRAEREKFVIKNKLCKKCLRLGHFAHSCKRNDCPQCDGIHDGTLCQSNSSLNNSNWLN